MARGRNQGAQGAPEDSGEAGIPVVALRPGYFGSLRAVGDKFTVPNERALGTWMQRQDTKPDEAADLT